MKKPLLVKGETRLPSFTALCYALAALIPDYFSTVLTFVGFVSVLRKKFAPKNQPLFGALGISILVFIGWMIPGIFYSSSLVSSFFTIGLWVLVFTKYYFYNKAATSEEIVDSVMYFGGIGAGVAGAIGIGQMVLFHIDRLLGLDGVLSGLFNPFWNFANKIMELFISILPDFMTNALPKMTFTVYATRACSTFSNPLFFATIEIMLLPFAAYLFLCASERKHRLIGLLCFFLAAGGIAFSYSRGPYIFAVIVCIILLLHGGKKCLKLLGIGVVSLGAVAVFARGTIARILTLFSSNGSSILNSDDVSVSTRIGLYSKVIEIIKEKPIFGHGTGVGNTRELLHEANIMQPHAHNIFLETWVETGVIGVILFCIILLIFTINMIRLFIKGGKARSYAVTLFASVAGFVLCGMTDCLFYGIKPLQYLMMVLGLSQAVFLLYFNKKSPGGVTK